LERSQLLWISQSYTHPNAGVKSHSHPYYHMFYIMEGGCRFTVEDSTYDLLPGSCMLVPRETEHGYCAMGTETMRQLEIKFSLPQNTMDKLLREDQCIYSEDPLVGSLFQQIIAEYSELGSLADDSATSYLTALLYALTKNSRSQKQRQFQFIDAAAYSELSQKIIRYLETHYAQDVSLDQLAEVLDYNKSYLCIAFKKDTQMTILDCLNTIRIRRAAELIVYSDHTLLQVAEMCGFASVSHFNRVFQKYVGITPGQCRRAYPVDILFADPKDNTGFPHNPNRFVYSVLAQKRITPEMLTAPHIKTPDL